MKQITLDHHHHIGFLPQHEVAYAILPINTHLKPHLQYMTLLAQLETEQNLTANTLSIDYIIKDEQAHITYANRQTIIQYQQAFRRAGIKVNQLTTTSELKAHPTINLLPWRKTQQYAQLIKQGYIYLRYSLCSLLIVLFIHFSWSTHLRNNTKQFERKHPNFQQQQLKTQQIKQLQTHKYHLLQPLKHITANHQIIRRWIAIIQTLCNHPLPNGYIQNIQTKNNQYLTIKGVTAGDAQALDQWQKNFNSTSMTITSHQGNQTYFTLRIKSS